MYAKLWAASGLDYPALLDRLIAIALDRHAAARDRRPTAG
jgi:D-alanine-D-alanine ligase